MHVREWLHKNKHVSTIAACGVILIGIGATAYQLLPERPSTQAWYTTDDGKTWFKDSNRKVPPFEYDGKEAVLAHVRECDGKPFVGYMERYKPEGAKKMREYRAQEDDGQEPNEGLASSAGYQLEYKKPGDAKWTSEVEKAQLMMLVDCPDGSPSEVVWP